MYLPHLGQTRSARQRDHLLQTPDTFIRAPLPGMQRCTAVVHVNPALGAAFTQYTAEMEPDGVLGTTDGQRFLYVLEGELGVNGTRLGVSGYCFVPEGEDIPVIAKTMARIAVIEKAWEPLHGVAEPVFFSRSEQEIEPQPLLGDDAIELRTLLPNELSHDFAVNTMTYTPGATLPMVEIHVMEHGLLMLEGGGIYRLGASWYPVNAGDFIWMAPYCPQWFGALGKSASKYLIYKDWNRPPL